MSDITLVNLTRSYMETGTPDTFTPLGPLYIAAALEEKGYSVDFRDYLTKNSPGVRNPLSPGAVHSFLEDSSDILGVSCVGSMLPAILLALRKLKREHPGKTIILGGIGATGAAEEILEHFPFIDIIVKGEGEKTAVSLMEALSAGEEISAVNGISYRKKDKIHSAPPVRWIEDLDRIPFPAYHKIDFADYSVIPLISSRGCPYRCTFCDVAPYWGRKNRKRSIENVIEEVEILAGKFGRMRIEFVDDTFTINKERVLEFCKQLKKKKLGINWSCFSRVDTIDKEMMEAMSGSGCVLIFYGIESGSDRILGKIDKQITRKQAWETIRESQNHFDVMASLMWGFPFETMEDFHETVDFFKQVAGLTSTTYLFSLNPFPLSKLYGRYGQRVEFSKEWGHRMGGIEKGELLDLIKTYPRVFPGFYYYTHEHFREKYKVLEKAGLMNTFMSCFELTSDG